MSAFPQKTAANYREMAERIASSGGKVFLFAGASSVVMPITIITNVAMLLACEKGRCLLIDLDTERDAVGKAFEMEDRQEGKPKAYKAIIENLFIWPARNFGKAGWVRAYAVVGRARDNADYVLVNAPKLAKHPECFPLLHTSDGVFVFGEKKDGEITKLAETARCMVMPV
ncbi:MAG TPA: hypothetical protein VLH60_04505 [Sedimentisphaerales bacterium]|nr:hypothetical protein [Sedimentisphaerales bacterium]